jgi:Uma2 family endonuclease
MLEVRGDASVPRFAYLEGQLEIMRPSKPHEPLKSRIGRLVEVWCIEREVEFSPRATSPRDPLADLNA